jgi:indole-3-glycerol phosphate synthase
MSGEPQGSLIERLTQRVSARALPLIAEVKVRSPAAGELLRGRRVEDIVAHFEAAGVAGVSVVTGAWFGGSAELLERVARATALPVLRKDFIVSPAHLVQSKSLGARAVLLTAKLLSASLLQSLLEQTHRLDLTAFVEVSSLRQLRALRLSPQSILALNNCDIMDREMTRNGVGRSLELLAEARSCGAGALVSASGIDSAQQARALITAGFDGLLVSTALLRANDLAAELAQFKVALEAPS